MTDLIGARLVLRLPRLLNLAVKKISKKIMNYNRLNNLKVGMMPEVGTMNLERPSLPLIKARPPRTTGLHGTMGRIPPKTQTQLLVQQTKDGLPSPIKINPAPGKRKWSRK